MEFLLLVLFIIFAAIISYGFDYLVELQFFKDIDQIERLFG